MASDARYYRRSVSELGAGGSYGNPDIFARTSRESDLEGLWSAADSQFYCGDLLAAPWLDNQRMPAVETLFYPDRQVTRYQLGSVSASKTLLVPWGAAPVSAALYLWFEFEGAAGRACEVRVDLRWNPTLSPHHKMAPAQDQLEKVVDSRLEGSLLLASTWARPPGRAERTVADVAPPKQSNPHECRAFGGSTAPSSCVQLQPSRVKLSYPAGEARLTLVLAIAPNGLDEARSRWRAAFAAADSVLAQTRHAVAQQIDRATLFTPAARINRGLAWAKATTYRGMQQLATGSGFVSDPPGDILVVREAAWLALGMGYVDPAFVTAMWAMIRRHGARPGGKIAENLHCGATPPLAEDFGLNINDDTPLWIWATRHQYALTRDVAWLNDIFPAVRDAAEHILGQQREGLVQCDALGTNTRGIASWRNRIPGYGLSGAVTELNAECIAALRAAAELGAVLGETEAAARWADQAQALAEALHRDLVSPATQLYALSRASGGFMRHDVTGDMVFPLLFDVAQDEVARRVRERLTQPDFWTAAGVRTVSATEPGYDPAYGDGLMGGIRSNLTAWVSYALRDERPDLLVSGMAAMFAPADAPHAAQRGHVVPGQFPEWLHGESFEAGGTALSPWLGATYTWLGLEGLAGITPRVAGEARVRLTPHLPPGWNWLIARDVALGSDRLAFVLLQGVAHVAGPPIECDWPVERYDEDVTARLVASGRVDAPGCVALRRGAEVTLWLATDDAATAKLDLPGLPAALALPEGAVQVFAFPFAAMGALPS